MDGIESARFHHAVRHLLVSGREPLCQGRGSGSSSGSSGLHILLPLFCAMRMIAAAAAAEAAQVAPHHFCGIAHLPAGTVCACLQGRTGSIWASVFQITNLVLLCLAYT